MSAENGYAPFHGSPLERVVLQAADELIDLEKEIAGVYPYLTDQQVTTYELGVIEMVGLLLNMPIGDPDYTAEIKALITAEAQRVETNLEIAERSHQ